MKKQIAQTGFTLTELLIVIAMIGVLAIIAANTLTAARVRARDAQRVAYINQINTALQLYYLKNNIYPTAITSGQALAINGVTYLNPVPANPAPRTDGGCSDSEFGYGVWPGNTSYSISFCLASATGAYSAGPTICDDGTKCKPCGQYTVTHGSVTYNTVKVGGQCWLDKNLNYGTMLATGATQPANNGIVEKHCPLAHGQPGSASLSESDCTTWGAVYTWYEAMNYSTSECNSGKCQGICPPGWHIPTDAELGVLETYLTDSGQTCSQTRSNTEGCSTAGTKLKSGGSSGMAVPLSSYRLGNGDWYYRGSYGDLWASTQYNVDYTYKRRVTSSLATVNRYYHDKTGSIGLRCVRN